MHLHTHTAYKHGHALKITVDQTTKSIQLCSRTGLNNSSLQQAFEQWSQCDQKYVWCSEKKKSLILIHFLFLNGKHNPCVSTLHIIVPKPQNVKRKNPKLTSTHLFVHANITKIHKKQKQFLYDSDSWQGAQCRPNGRSVLNFPQAHSLRLSGKYLPSYHTHNCLRVFPWI